MFLILSALLPVITTASGFFGSYPFLEGNYFTYATYMWLYSASIAFVIFLFFFSLYIIMSCIYTKLCKGDNKDNKNNNNNEFYSMEEEDEFLENVNINQKENYFLKEKTSTLCSSICFVFMHLFKFISITSLIFTFIIIGLFGGLPVALTFFIEWFISWFGILHTFSRPVVVPRLLSHWYFNKLEYKFMAIYKLQFPLLILSGLLTFILFVLVAVLTDGGCFALFNVLEGGYVINAKGAMEATISTKFSRSFLPTPCPHHAGPCHVYLTMPSTPSKQMIVNIHFPPGLAPSVVLLRDSNNDMYNNYTTTVFPIPELESKGSRDVHSVLLDDLLPNSIYSFDIQWIEEDGTIHYTSNIKKFKTIPSDGSAFTFLIGGDSGANEIVESINIQAGKQDPLFAVVGGDLAYDNAMFTCYRCWDAFLDLWEKNMVTSQGLTIPMLFPVGNHDVGSNDNSGAKQNPNSPVLYFRFFPQQSILDNGINILPQNNQRSTYFYHLFGNSTVIISLDSAHVVSVVDQLQWLETVLSLPQVINRPVKIITYHVPIYPSTDSMWNSTFSLQGRQYWVPIFDKYGVSAVFENHVHSFKRTVPMKNSEKYLQGTVYFGDGNWGVPLSDVPDESELKDYENDRIAIMSPAHHYWRVNIGSNGLTSTFTAFNVSSEILDSVSRISMNGKVSWIDNNAKKI